MSQPTVNLTETVHSAIDAHRHERGPLLVILQEVQERLGYVPPAAVPLIARELNLSRADVHGVLTFYHDLRTEPPGRTTLSLCRAEACQAVGAEALVAQVEEALGVKTGQTAADGSVTVNQVFCLGNCALGPSALVGGRLHGRLDRDRVVALVRAEAS
ncbi:formate dehydrogenase subunit gamma [Streptomyces polyrhachis]|uniref:Formate dehydrogenase subunit gamma n=1 Tax=Streptomyces polyrhachis TaxID=1282885 RepID=A0ABW2GKE8_9ACTN